MKKILFVTLIILSFVSCKTSLVMIPGEKKVRETNLYKEYYNLAEEYVKLEKYSKAIELYTISMNEKSLHDYSYYRIGKCYAMAKEYDKAEEVFNNILKKDPENVTLQSTVAYLAAMKGDNKKAAALYRKLIIDNPDDANLLVNYISVLLSLKDYETAKVNLDYLEKKYPDNDNIEKLKETFPAEVVEDKE